MRRLAFLLPALALAACSTTGTVRLNADKAFLTAQVAFKSAQQTTLATCSVPAAQPTAACQQAIDILHQGAAVEAAGFSAQQAGTSSDMNVAVTNLTNLIAQLTQLGVLKAN